MAEGAALAATIGALDGMAHIEAAVDLRADGVTVRLSWYSGLTERHVSLAQQVSAAAREAGAVPRRQRNRIHVDVSLPRVEAEARVQAALAAGGTLVSDAHAPMWWTLADPEGNEVDIAAHTDLD